MATFDFSMLKIGFGLEIFFKKGPQAHNVALTVSHTVLNQITVNMVNAVVNLPFTGVTQV